MSRRPTRRSAQDGRKAEFEPWPFYLTAWEEDKYIIGQANIELDEKGNIINERNAARKAGEFITAAAKRSSTWTFRRNSSFRSRPR